MGHDHAHRDGSSGSGSTSSEDLLQHFWGTTIKPESDYTLSLERSELHLTQACLTGAGAATLYLSTARMTEPVAICSLGHGGSTAARSALLDIEVFPDDEAAIFRVEGTAGVAISGCIAIFGGRLEVSDDEEEGEEEEEGKKKESGGKDDEDEDEEEEEVEDEMDEEEEEESARPAAPAMTAVEKMKAAKRQREEAAAAAAPEAPAKKAKQTKEAAPAPAPAPTVPKAPASSLAPKASAHPPAMEPKAPAAPAPKPAPAAPPAPAAGVSSKSQIAAADTGLKKLAEGMVQYRDAEVGVGPAPVKGKNVTVSYVGKLSNGKVFDKSDKFTFRLGVGQVIKGWDVGVAGMRVGGRRTLVIHPSFGYGKGGSPPVIPPNATLIFEVELLRV